MKHLTPIIIGLLLAAAAARAQEQQSAPSLPQTTQAPAAAPAQPTREEFDQLNKRLEELEQAVKTAPQPAVETAFKESSLKIDGRMFASIFSSGDNGRFSNRSVDVPDAKIRFTFAPAKDVTLVCRLNLNRATFNNVDNLYVELKNWGGLFPEHTLVVGKHKIDVGQETWTDSPVESIVITSSVSRVSGYDECLRFFGPLMRGARPVTYSLALLNGTRGFNPSAAGLAWIAKTGAAVTPELYFSGSYYHGANLPGDNGPELNVANLQNAPAGATAWRRTLWEADARYGYGKTGYKSVVATPVTVPWQFAAAYGQFNDSATGAASRKGNYWYAETLYNLTPVLYLGSRYSQVALDNGYLDLIDDSPVPVNRYNRLALGIGYRLAYLTHVKAEYTINNTSGATPEPSLNQFAVGFATKF